MGNKKRRICGTVKIELRSDICAGSGYSYAGVIDSDVAYDEYGLPFIPARRLKGCMREPAGLACPDAAEALFGRTGDYGTKGIVLWNAYIDGYDAIIEELKKLDGTKRKEAVYLSPQNLLKLYTGVRAQTKLCADTGTAERNTLRFIRVTGQYDPLKDKKEPLCFYARVEFDDAYIEQLRRVMKAVRNIGMNRNRGLGSVRCSLMEAPADAAKPEMEMPADASGGEKSVCLAYVLRSQEPLLMSSDNAQVSDSYISGKSILGNLAGAYLCGQEEKAEGEEFKDLFLNGKTIFTNAYITVPPNTGRESAAQWPDYYPAPCYLNQLKKTKVFVNRLSENTQVPPGKEKEYDISGGNVPKGLKTHFVHERKPNVFDVVEPQREILYHNSKKELLYSLEAVKKGQCFKGEIYTTEKYAGLLKALLEGSRLSFGKSKTAQYGACALAAEVAVKNTKTGKISARGGEKIAVTLVSDAVFFDETNGYTVNFEEIKEQAAKQFRIPYDRAVDEGSAIQTKEILGYHTVWNLRRPGIAAVKAGSVLVYTLLPGQDWEIDPDKERLFIGERNLEGYGQVQIRNCRDISYAAGILDTSGGPDEDWEIHSCRPFLQRILIDQILERMIFLYMGTYRELQLTSSTIGRLNLMLQESLNAYGNDPKQAFQDFCSRADSIKRKKEKAEAFRLLQAFVLKDKPEAYELDIWKMTKAGGDPKMKEMLALLKLYAGEEYEKELAGIWGIYMKHILAYHKYLKKQEGGNKSHAQ